MATGVGKLIAIVGQTASGKSALAMELAKLFDGELICADSRTVYRGMDIGTAKPTLEDQREVPHHVLDVVNPDERFTAVNFKSLAEQAIGDIQSRGKLPIMVGGTGLYIDAVLFNYSFGDPDAPRDPVNARHQAVESRGTRDELRPNTLTLGLDLEKEVLRERISGRAEAMIEQGLIDELRGLLNTYPADLPSLQTTDYKPFIEYLNGTLSLEEAKALFIRNDLQLAKRQKTWFKRNKSIQWVKSPQEAVDIATTFIKKD